MTDDVTPLIDSVVLHAGCESFDIFQHKLLKTHR